jgi:signal peptidase I
LARLFFLILLGAAGAYGVRRFAFEGIYIASDSMSPALPEGRHIFVNKAALLISPPRRGDVVMFDLPGHPEKGLVKRVIGVAGDRLEIRHKQVFLNGQELAEPYVIHRRADEALEDDNMPEVTVPADCVFLMGDNRDQSKDSRDWKNEAGEWSPFVPLARLQGLVQRS